MIQNIGMMKTYKQKLREIELKLNPKTSGFLLFKEAIGPAEVGPMMSRGDAGIEATTNILPPKEDEFQEGLNLQKIPTFDVGDIIIVNGIDPRNQMSNLNGKHGKVIQNLDTEKLAKNRKYGIEFPKQEGLETMVFELPVHLLKHYHNLQEGLNLQKKQELKKGDKVVVLSIPEGVAMSWLSGEIGKVVSDPRYNENWKTEVAEIWFDKFEIGTYEVPTKYLQHYRQPSEINEVSPYEESDWLQSEIHKQELKQITEWLKTTPEPYDDFHWDGGDLLIMKEGKVIETIERSVLSENNIVPETRQLMESHKYNYGCMMTYFDVPIWNDVLNLIEPEDLYTDEEGYGLESDPHATLLFGLHHNEIDPEELKNILMGVNDIPVNVKGISHFDDEYKPYDVVKFDLESDLLHQLNGKLREYPHTNDYPEYHPHMTIGYVKKGMGGKYDGKFPSLPTVLGKHIVYSHPSGQKDRWELPIQQTVMNTDEDLMEGLNLAKKKQQKSPIRIITGIEDIDGNWVTDFNSGFLDEIGENADNWSKLKISYIDLNGDDKEGVFGDFNGLYVKFSNGEYRYIMGDADYVSILYCGYYLLIAIRYAGDMYYVSDMGEHDFVEVFKDAYHSLEDFSCFVSSKDGLKFNLGVYDLEGPGVLINILGKLYVLNSELSEAEVS